MSALTWFGCALAAELLEGAIHDACRRHPEGEAPVRPSCDKLVLRIQGTCGACCRSGSGSV